MNDYMNKLVGIGLTSLEAKVYFTLFKKKNFTATEISKLTHISRQKAYEVLSKLEQKGLCAETLGKIKKYSVVNPNIGLGCVLKEFEEKKKVIKELSDFLFPLYNAEKENTDSLDYIQVLKGKNRIAEKFKLFEENTKSEILIFTKAPYWAANENSARKKDKFGILKRGVKVKSIYEEQEAKNQEFLDGVEVYDRAGEEIRIAKSLPLKLAIFDEEIVIYSLRDRVTMEPTLTSIIIEHPDFARFLKRTFYSYWSEAMTLEEFKIKNKK